VSRRKATRRLHDAPVLLPPPKASYLALENAKRVVQLQHVTQWMAFTVGMWVTQDVEDIDEDFAALWGLTCWFCGLQLPGTVHDFWTGSPILDRKRMPTRFDYDRPTAGEGPTQLRLPGEEGQRTAGDEATEAWP
jgi:hypothetical protein